MKVISLTFVLVTSLLAEHIPLCNSTLLEYELFCIYIYLYLIYVLLSIINSSSLWRKLIQLSETEWKIVYSHKELSLGI